MLTRIDSQRGIDTIRYVCVNRVPVAVGSSRKCQAVESPGPPEVEYANSVGAVALNTVHTRDHRDRPARLPPRKREPMATGFGSSSST